MSKIPGAWHAVSRTKPQKVKSRIVFTTAIPQAQRLDTPREFLIVRKAQRSDTPTRFKALSEFDVLRVFSSTGADNNHELANLRR